MLSQGNYFVVSVKLNICQRQIHCIDDQDKFQSVKDADNEFKECQTLRKKFQLIGISPVILCPYKVHVDCSKDSESDSYDKNDMKEKVNDLVCLHEVMQEELKTASYSEQIQILTSVPNKWSQMYC